jgi:hypothetical protein
MITRAGRPDESPWDIYIKELTTTMERLEKAMQGKSRGKIPVAGRLGFVALIVVAMMPGSLRAEVSFNRDIRPLLSDRCFKCHGPDGGKAGEKWEGGLRLDTREGALADLAAVKHATENRKRVEKGLPEKTRGAEARFAIIPGKPEASLLVERIMAADEDERMPPADSNLTLTDEERKLLRQWISEGAKWDKHWAFVAPMKTEPPAAHDAKWPINEIDRFVLARLNKQGVKPAPPAAPTAWLRRVTLDLTGLPPTPVEIAAFIADSSQAAREKVVARLLETPDHAEHMASIWLDNARYGDSNGYQFDNARTMWPWRDWVIEAFRRNMAYDAFVTEQLAGDLLPEPTQAQLVATGFNRNHGYSIEGGISEEEYRVTYANDKTTTAGTLFLGLTMDCTRCHDHKYDPLTMKDYYSLSAFFNTSAEKGAPGEDGRKQMAAEPFLEYSDPAQPGVKVRAMIMKESPRKSFVLNQGLFDQPGEEVFPGTPAVLPAFGAFPKNRLGLAHWLTAAENPLFSRVAANRLWQQFFGTGIVKTADNFGMQGELPSHPELLDWLAVAFREGGWDQQRLIRMIVLSATYGQSATFRPELQDPENRLLARGPSFRLPAEMIRDQALAVSGLLARKVGGPSVMPYQPEGIWEDLSAPPSHAEIYVRGKGPDLYRKTMYTYWRRSVIHPALSTFDAPSRDVCTVRREATNTPLQALAMRHDPTYLECARVLAQRLLENPTPADLPPIREAFHRILARPPSDAEEALLAKLHKERLARYQDDPKAAENTLRIGEAPISPDIPPARLAALADVCHVILNLSETITRN